MSTMIKDGVPWLKMAYYDKSFKANAVAELQ